MLQLILHLIGDYITQTDWMAKNKTKDSFAAYCHSAVYSIPFLFIFDISLAGYLVILVTHFFIDRFRLARFVIFTKNKTTNWKLKWVDCAVTGYHKDDPIWLTTWLLIITDNALHLTINYLALTYL